MQTHAYAHPIVRVATLAVEVDDLADQINRVASKFKGILDEMADSRRALETASIEIGGGS